MAPQIDRALGATVLGGIASRLGLGGPIVSTAIAYILPKVIGLLTPGGVIPKQLPAEVTSFLHPQPAQRVVETVTPRVAAQAPRVAEQVAPRRMTVVRDGAAAVVHDEPHMSRWLWPLLAALAVLGLGSYLFSNSNRPAVTTPMAQAPVVVPPAPPAPTLPPRLAISNVDGVIHYSGSVHDEETRGSIINGLKAVFGADKIQATSPST